MELPAREGTDASAHGGAGGDGGDGGDVQTGVVVGEDASETGGACGAVESGAEDEGSAARSEQQQSRRAAKGKTAAATSLAKLNNVVARCIWYKRKLSAMVPDFEQLAGEGHGESSWKRVAAPHSAGEGERKRHRTSSNGLGFAAMEAWGLELAYKCAATVKGVHPEPCPAKLPAPCRCGNAFQGEVCLCCIRREGAAWAEQQWKSAQAPLPAEAEHDAGAWANSTDEDIRGILRRSWKPSTAPCLPKRIKFATAVEGRFSPSSAKIANLFSSASHTRAQTESAYMIFHVAQPKSVHCWLKT